MNANISRALSVSFMDVVIDAAWKAFLLLLFASVAASLARKLSAAVRHRIWCCAFCGVVLLPLVSIMFPKWNCAVLPAQPAVEENAPVDAAPPLPRTVGDGGSVVDRRRYQTVTSDARDRFGGSAIRADAPSADDLPGAHLEQLNADGDSVRRLTSLETVLLVGWGMGVVVFLAPLIVGITASRVFFTNCRSVSQGQWIELLAENRSRLGLSRGVRVVETDDPIIPMTYGLFRPVVLVPETSRGWTDSCRRIVLMHELAHIKRLDVPWQIIGRLACSLHWFNPLAWHALRRLRLEQELACDDCVLSLGEKAKEYAAQLVQLARTYRSSRLACGVSAARSSTLERRIVALLDPVRAHGPLSKRLAYTLVIASLVLVFTVAVVRPIARAAEKQRTADSFAAKVRPDEIPAIAADVSQNSAVVASHFIRGHVEDPHGKPIVGARVWLQRYCAGVLQDKRLRGREAQHRHPLERMDRCRPNGLARRFSVRRRPAQAPRGRQENEFPGATGRYGRWLWIWSR